MPLSDRDYQQDRYRQLEAEGRQRRAHRNPYAGHGFQPLTKPKSSPPDLARIGLQVFVWLCIFMAIAFVISIVAPQHFKPGAGVRTPVSTPKAAEPAASMPLATPTRRQIEA